jgi:hypothetical protein
MSIRGLIGPLTTSPKRVFLSLTEAYRLGRMDPSTIVPTYGASRISADVFSHRPTPAVSETIAMARQADTTGQRSTVPKLMKEEWLDRIYLK